METVQQNNTIISARAVREAARAEGFSLCGIAPYRAMPEHLAWLEQWLEAGRHGRMDYMKRNVSKRADARELFPAARTIIVCAVNYRNGAWDRPDDGRPGIASYAFARDYHSTIKEMLRRILSKLRTSYPGLGGRALTDSAPLLEKAWAVEAGLGWIGKNSLLITPRFGSSVLLGELLIDAPVDAYDPPYTPNRCGSCRRCIDACPNSAIGDNRTLDTSRCISRLTVEPGKDLLLQEEGRPAGERLAGWVFGCDICQMCCPHNACKPLYDNAFFAPVIDPWEMDMEFCRKVTWPEFERLFSATPMERPVLKKIFETIKRSLTEE